MLHLTPETEALARKIAQTQGLSVEEAIRLAIEAAAGASAPPTRKRMERSELIRRMEEISARSGARTLVDPRSPDELLGYDEFGLPR
jgi:antitoxin VapB